MPQHFPGAAAPPPGRPRAGDPIDPSAPTNLPPGGAEKLDVMARRAAARLPLFHPGDELLALPKGVSWDARCGRWRARRWCRRRRRTVHLGLFATRDLAARAARRDSLRFTDRFPCLRPRGGPVRAPRRRPTGTVYPAGGRIVYPGPTPERGWR